MTGQPATVSPFPSNQLFLAAGLTRVNLPLVGAAFFVGRAIEYTIAAGAGLCDSAAVRVLVEEGPHEIEQLLSWGADGTLRTWDVAAQRPLNVVTLAPARG